LKLSPLELRRPACLADALETLGALGSDAQVLAGGQSLLPLLRYRVLRPHVLLDINRITSLAALEHTPAGLRIGALVRHSDLEALTVQQHGPLAPLLMAHARQIAFWAVRNRGTAVGSILQADPKGDWPLMFSALDAQIELSSLRGSRSVPVRQFILGPLLTARAVDELATGLLIPIARTRISAWGRGKLMHRAGEYAMCSSIVIRLATGWECWLGAAGDKPTSMPCLAAALNQSAVPPRKQLLATAAGDIEQALPEMGPLDRHRHAVNAIDAAEQALGRLAHD
jgi:CO/xanthine dehydrogenase FAD-binding subunit